MGTVSGAQQDGIKMGDVEWSVSDGYGEWSKGGGTQGRVSGAWHADYNQYMVALGPCIGSFIGGHNPVYQAVCQDGVPPFVSVVRWP
eukprot:1147901-Pelagomonas_calceolata.AAC.4